MSGDSTTPYIPQTQPEATGDLLGAALAEYEQLVEAGRRPDREAFLERHRQQAAAARPLLQAADRLERVTAPVRRAISGWPELPGYEVQGELGRGGMGVVYLARQQGTEQLVALKTLLPEWSTVPWAVEQFRFEARAAARLRHPNRVRILHLGEHHGVPFYAMELIDGSDLARHAAAKKVRDEIAVRYVAEVAEAAHEVHQRGLIHRDIKPRNILLRREEGRDETLLTDFGVATPADAAPADGEANVVGTLPYMSPEQTQDSRTVTAASDVYSLGATLYELLTGSPPFRAPDRLRLVKAIREDPPVRPRRVQPDVSRQIERICLRCLEKDPRDRYPTALALAQALRAYLLDVHHARHLVGMGSLFIIFSLLMFLLNAAVYLLTWAFTPATAGYLEPVIWALIFAMYPALFGVFLLAPATEAGHEHILSRRELWSIWGGKMFAAITISIALRAAFAHEALTAIRLAYVVFAALSGMASFAQISRMDRRLYVSAGLCWLVSIAMVFWLEYAPLLYGVLCLAGIPYGLYLRRLGKELGVTRAPSAAHSRP
jgi:predicted Ser/Thr protein kinase